MTDSCFYGLNELDVKLARHLDFDGGVFFEAGANDGVNQSNTCHFERHRGWTGILVEPIPSRFKACRGARPKSHCVWAALTPPEWPDPFVELTFCNLMTVTHSDQVMLDREAHIQDGIQFLSGEEPHLFHAPARTISSILAERNVERVDLLSLDIEGFEVPALQGLDQDRFDVRHICVEVRDIGAVQAVLDARYEMIDRLSFHDYLFRRRT